MDEVITPDLASIVFKHLREYVIRDNAPDVADKAVLTPQSSRHGEDVGNEESSDPEKRVINTDTIQTMDLTELQKAYDHR